MKNTNIITWASFIGLAGLVTILIGICGCDYQGYESAWLHTDEISTVYVEMFENKTFRRGQEYNFTDALVKRIENDTPYKIVSDRSRADSIITGYLASIKGGVLTGERETGRPLEKDLEITAVVSWKNLKTGALYLDNRSAVASAGYTEWLAQGPTYAADLAVNRLAEKTVEMMEKQW